jgi:hypothetical protein
MKTSWLATATLVAMTSLVMAQAKSPDPKAGLPPPPKPAPEIAAQLKAMGSRTNCTGVFMGGADGKTEMKLKGSETYKVALDGWFINISMTGSAGEGKAAMKMKMEQYMTYDPTMSKWRLVGMMNDGSTMAGTADMASGKVDAQSDVWGGTIGAAKLKDHGDMTDPKAGMKMWGEASKDGGKTWNKVYEMTCRK